MVFTASRSKASSETNSRRQKVSSAKKKRRTKGPSEKIRSLAALSLESKLGYLKLSDLIDPEDTELEELLEARLPRRVFRKGDTIFPTDRKEPTLFLVKTGSVNIFRPSSKGGEHSVKKIDPGTLFGEMPMLGQSMLGANAEAAETTRVAFITASDIELLAAKSPKVALNIVRQLGPRLVEAERRHEQAAFQPVTSRVASLLMRLANQANQVIGYTHQEMADVLGVYRETVTNAIAELKQDRLIEVGRKRITLLDTDGLVRLESI